jgi:predicted RNA-binding Zn-ribbon protein involved in translation (DUF1610 family)
MSKWTHSLCEACYRVLEPGREPVQLAVSICHRVVCCRCQKSHQSGISYRGDPQQFTCGGHHEEEDANRG